VTVESKPARFHSSRPTDLREARPWHRLAYIIRVLPASLERLSAHLTPATCERVLDYGAAESPYRHFFPESTDFVAADLPGNPNAGIDIQPDGSLPVPDDSFDAVLSTQVLEHVSNPALYLAECHRVLRPGGRMLLSTHGLMVYHPDPDDYWRWTCAGLQRAVREAGFEIVHFEGIMGLAASGIQLFQDAVYWHLPRVLRPVFALVSQSLIALMDRLQGDGARKLNSLVFAVVAEKP
jgi:SAM-dependent methyltransferase